MKMSFKHLIFLTTILVSLTACAGATPVVPTTTMTFIFAPPTITVEPTLTPEITFTPFPTATVTVTVTPTSSIGWSAMSITFSDLISTYGVFFTIPGLEQVYDVKIDGVPYSCYTDAAYPHRLFCYGPKFREEINVPVIFSPQGGGDPVYTGALVVSSAMFATTYPECIASTWCPDRYKKFSCETEDRTWYEPRCLVSTCSDACGFCLGIDTCALLGSVPKP